MARALPFVTLGFDAALARREHRLAYLGTTLRGLLGYALKEAACVVAHQDCARCTLRDACVYPAVFDGVPSPDRTILRKYPNAPQPFVLLVASPGHWWGEGQRLRWGLRLFGPAARAWTWILEAFRAAGERGVGTHRVPYALERVVDLAGVADVESALTAPPESIALHPTTWSAGADSVAPPAVESLTPQVTPLAGPLRISLRTPLHIRASGARQQAIAPLELVLAGRRRWHVLSELYGTDTPEDAEPRPARVEDRDFTVVQQSLADWSIQRFSGRQKRAVPLQGTVGDLVIDADWSRVGGWLSIAERMHVGKYTSFGFGRVTITPWEGAS